MAATSNFDGMLWQFSQPLDSIGEVFVGGLAKVRQVRWEDIMTQCSVWQTSWRNRFNCGRGDIDEMDIVRAPTQSGTEGPQYT